MNKNISTYLDIARVTAAFAVFFSHFKRESISYGLLKPLGMFGEEGVVIFFVISGVVIAYVHEHRESIAAEYFIARLSRLWSVVVPAIALTIFADLIGSHQAPAIYDETALPPMWGWNLSSLWHALAPMLFLNRIAGWSVDPGTNGPFWSLCYEFWYYMAFGAFCFSKGVIRIALLLFIALIVNRDVLCLFPIWILGVFSYKATCNSIFGVEGRLRGISFALIIGALLIVMAGKYKIFHAIQQHTNIDIAYLNLGEKYIFGLMFSGTVLMFPLSSNFVIRLFELVRSYVIFFARRTFSLYLYHVPLIFLYGALTIGLHSHIARILLIFFLVLTTVFLLAQITELKRDVPMRLLQLLFGRQGVGPRT